MSTILSDPAYGVPPAPSGPPGTLGWLRSHVSRFANGPVHARRRGLVLDELARIQLGDLRTAVAGGASPVEALASAMGVRGVTDAVAIVAPAYLTGSATPAVDAAVASLVAAFGGVADELCAARIAILVQACLPTAALIASARAYGSIDAALERDPPVRATRRVQLAGGETVVVELGGATAFGAGPRACPGQAAARAMVEGALDALP